jgi:two-component system, chemotaxis family, sensor kinase Cph1
VNASVDLSNCDRELIHIPGRIQSHGFFFLINKDASVLQYSENIGTYIPSIQDEIIGKAVTVLTTQISYMDGSLDHLLQQALSKTDFDKWNPTSVTINGMPFYMILSRITDDLLVEFEPARTDIELDIQRIIGPSIIHLLSDKSIEGLCATAAREVKEIIGYDRVMIYRFAEDGHGEVVAEAKNNDLLPWVGLHYPASDIPLQARELYRVNLTRIIADVHSTPAAIISEKIEGQPPLDLTHAQLRAVSPIHIQYLKNMGVASSYSVSIICRGKLWGLIACHSYTPKFIDFKLRQATKLIGHLVSSTLEFLEEEKSQRTYRTLSSNLETLSKAVQDKPSMHEALIQGDINLLNVVHASGVVMQYENRLTKRGLVPEDKDLEDLLRWLLRENRGTFYYTAGLATLYPAAQSFQKIASGVLLLVISRELNEYIVWFKPELLQTVKWAGNPDKPAVSDPTGLTNISPRNSFEVWTEMVAGKAEPWAPEDLNAVIKLKEEIASAINMKAGALRVLHERLRDAYEELDTFSYTISHDLKSPLSAIKGYAQLLQLDPTVPSHAQNFIARIDERATKMNKMINEVLDYTRVGRQTLNVKSINIGEILDDLLKEHDIAMKNGEVEIIIGSTPPIIGEPVMISQVFSNLIGNAVKYSRYRGPGKIHIEGKESPFGVQYRITDNGTGIPKDKQDEVFALFSRLNNAHNVEGSGVGLAIVKRIVEKHRGKIWIESELGKGSTFILELYLDSTPFPAAID